MQCQRQRWWEVLQLGVCEGQKLDASSFFRGYLLDAFLLWRLAAGPFSLFGGQEQDALLS